MDWNKETATIIYASNDGYAGHLAASLYSLMDHNRNIRNMDIYVLSVELNEEFKKRLTDMGKGFGRKLYVVELGDLKSRFDFDIDTRGFDISAMARIFAAQVLPERVERALYLDCDTIVCRSIRSLYDTKLDDRLAGMVMEPTVYKEMKEAVGLTKDQPYYNSGVILMNLRLWRKEDVLKQLLEFYKSRGGRLFACDQDTINGALKGRIFTLPVKYNYFTNYRYFRYKTLVSLCAAYEEVGEDAYREAGRSPVIIHYSGDERPWIAGNHNHFRKLYEHNLAHTPWKDTPKRKGKENYMHMWWVFNHLTWICPPFRLWVSRHMGMKLVDSRGKSAKS